MSSKITGCKDGGPAFPRVVPIDYGEVYYGMTLRDWFAGQALAGLAVADEPPSNPDARERHFWWTAKNAYDLADAMLKAREAGE